MSARRTLLAALALGALSFPLGCLAQYALKVWRVGYLSPYPSRNDARFEAFRQKLSELGYVEGKTVAIEYVSAEGNPERLSALAAHLVRRNVDLIMAAGGTPSANAAKAAARKIPVVFAGLANPVDQGFAMSLARPGGNFTGTATQSPDVAVKLLALFKEIAPAAGRIAILSNPTNSWHVLVLREMQFASKKLKLDISVVKVTEAVEFQAAFREMERDRANAVLILGDALFNNESRTLAALGARYGLPVLGMNSFVAENGGLMSYGANRLDVVRRAAILVDKIIKGAKPADLPVEQPTEFELIVNTKAATALGIEVPQSILVRADRRIE